MTPGPVQTFLAPTASNYATEIGRVVLKSALATGQTRATLATTADDGTQSNCPLGIIVSAENANGGAVGVCLHGMCVGRAGADIAVTDTLLMANGDGDLIPATEGNFVAARNMAKVAVGAAIIASAGQFLTIFVQPGNYEVT